MDVWISPKQASQAFNIRQQVNLWSSLYDLVQWPWKFVVIKVMSCICADDLPKFYDIIKINFLKSYLYMLHSSKVVNEWAIHPTVGMTIRFGRGPDFTSKKWRPTKSQLSAVSQKRHIFSQHTPQ